MKNKKDNKKEKGENISKGLELLRKGRNLGGMISKKRENWHRR